MKGFYLIEVMPDANPHGLFYVQQSPGCFLWTNYDAAIERAAKEAKERNGGDGSFTVSLRGPLFSKSK